MNVDPAGVLPRFAVVSHVLPPSFSGQAVVLYRILNRLDPRRYCVVSRENYDAASSAADTGQRLQAPYHHIQSRWHLATPNVPGLRAVGKSLSAVLQFIPRARAIARIVRAENCDLLIACSGDILDLPAACLASHWTGIPFMAYVFDDYGYQWPQWFAGFVARRIAGAVFRRATAVIVPNEFLRDAYCRRYAISPQVIHNPCAAPESDSPVPWPAHPGEIRIVYTGAVYEAHYDAFQRLLTALARMGRDDVKLHLYTAQTADDLAGNGIVGPVVYHDHVTPKDARNVQRTADVLFLPLAFRSPYPELIRTSAPGKMGEYLASGRPVFAHAPGDSFVSWYFNTHEVGRVVTEPDAAALATGLGDVLDNDERRRHWTTQAETRARQDFSVSEAVARFTTVLTDWSSK